MDNWLRLIFDRNHWFKDWGRDSMISYHGITLLTGRCEDAMNSEHLPDVIMRNSQILKKLKGQTALVVRRLDGLCRH